MPGLQQAVTQAGLAAAHAKVGNSTTARWTIVPDDPSQRAKARAHQIRLVVRSPSETEAEVDRNSEKLLLKRNNQKQTTRIADFSGGSRFSARGSVQACLLFLNI